MNILFILFYGNECHNSFEFMAIFIFKNIVSLGIIQLTNYDVFGMKAISFPVLFAWQMIYAS